MSSRVCAFMQICALACVVLALLSSHAESSVALAERPVWGTTTPLPNARATPFGSAGREAVFYAGRVYVFGGKNGLDARLTDVYTSPVQPGGNLALWTRTTPLPGQFDDQAVVRVGAYIYLLTGGAGSRAVFVAPIAADGSLGAWRRTTALPESRQAFAVAAAGTYLYTSGGNSQGTRDAVQFTQVESNGDLAPWRNATPLPTPIEGHVMIAAAGALYVLAPSGSVYYAPIADDGTLAPWNSTSPIPATFWAYSAFAYEARLFVLGGDSARVYESSILPSGELQNWRWTSSLPVPRKGMWTGEYNGYAYAIGGISDDKYTPLVAFLDLNARSVSRTYLPVVGSSFRTCPADDAQAAGDH